MGMSVSLWAPQHPSCPSTRCCGLGRTWCTPRKRGAITNTCPRNPDVRFKTTSPQPPKWGVAASASPPACPRTTPAPTDPESTLAWDGTPCFYQQCFCFISIWREMHEEGRPTHRVTRGLGAASGPGDSCRVMSCPMQWRERGGLDMADRSDEEPRPNGGVVARRRSHARCQCPGAGSGGAAGQPL